LRVAEDNMVEAERYDVCIMGGGPAGSTLAALLARQTSLKIALFERDFFPREHIGESFTHRATPILEESGVLGKVLASECHVMKYGGIYAWDAVPLVRFFEDDNVKREGVYRWSIHCNRSEFDTILLEHARSLGVDVKEGVGVQAAARRGEDWDVELSDGTHIACRFFVEGSGRQTSIVGKNSKTWLSDYKNIAIWNHVVRGRKAQTLDAEWNVFKKAGESFSPIANFSFQDGWFWYIPVPKMIQGKRVVTHSLGMVTDPQVLKEPGKRYTDATVLFDTAKRVPLLGDLLVDAQPASDKVLTATNYSMISERMCDYDERWMLIGDSSFFVDPLFSTGIGFALASAHGAAHVIKKTLDDGIPETHKRDLWQDYADGWQEFARAFAYAIDQWYHAIAQKNAQSVYWNRRGAVPTFEGHRETFAALVDIAFVGELFNVATPGGSDPTWRDIAANSPAQKALERQFAELNISDATVLRLAPDTVTRRSPKFHIFPEKGVQRGFRTIERDPTVREALRQYWADPVKNGHVLPPSFSSLKEINRVQRGDAPSSPQVRFSDNENGPSLLAMLKTPTKFGSLKLQLAGGQDALLKRLIVARLVEISS
jgi:flavin-dependent dehydrogenase